MPQDSRKPATAEAQSLLHVAEQDWLAAEILVQHPEAPLAVVGFHIQQYAEKVMKAVLVSHAVIFRRTHDLMELANLLETHNLTLPLARPLLRQLNLFAVTARYGHIEGLALTADMAMEILNAVQVWLKQEIDVPDDPYHR
jgi:HEPN domain-containing protein